MRWLPGIGLVVVKGGGWGDSNGTRDLCADGTGSHLDCGGSYTNLLVIKLHGITHTHTHSQMRAWETGEI